MSQEYKFMLKDLECQENDHPFQKRVLQIVHYAPGTNEIVAIKTPHGALDDVRCPECDSLPKEPDD